MNQEIKKQWVEALRSGKYKQGKFKLKRNDQYCCLGVLCDIVKGSLGKDWENIRDVGKGESFCNVTTLLPWEVANLAQIDVNPYVEGVPLIKHNDSGEWNQGGVTNTAKTFAEIADLIEKHL